MKLYQILEQQLKKEPNFVTDNGDLKKWVVINKAQNFDEELLELLLTNDELKTQFFKEIAGATIFNQSLFIQFLEQKNYLNDSYTQYKNKVGLTIDDKFLKQRNEVSLVWPFKDCILEGGQSREEDKREEIFFNEILAQDEITQLLDPKVLTNAKRFDSRGEKPLDQFNRNADGTITDNLVIKGNNLLALHTLKEEFTGKVKLIYIDPPYNTGNDGFKYNDSFNHSTWLTFMKNRLIVAKQLLQDNGIIAIHCDDNEQAYLKVLMDEIFGRENFIANSVRIAKAGGGHDSQFLAIEYDYVLIATKNKRNLVLNKMQIDTEKDSKYKLTDEYVARRGKYYLRDLDYTGSYSESLDYPIQIKKDKVLYAGGKFGKPNTWRWSKKKFDWGIENGFIVIDEKKEKVYIKQYQFVDNEDNIRTREVPYRAMINSLNSEGAKDISSLFDDKVFNFPKPESFIKYILDFSTQENDIVLDYHLGSGTTASVAHKMNRQYIGIEQMDYIETVAVERLKKVIDGEQGGISKSVNWQGGGSFVYLELKKYNQTFIEQIEEAKDSETLLKIWELMKEKSFLNYNVDIKKQDEHIEEFKALELAQQKQHLCELLNKNQLYVNLSEMNDERFECSEAEKCLNQDFYKI
ncbi:MAG: site-specific DNA-methyltransferase [Chitinophagales bacterium]|nr:site-specific DNA-methyltransferase [Chitinophagales bacterium]